MPERTLSRRVLHILGRVVPRGERHDWLLEWEAELRHAATAESDDSPKSGRALGRLAAAAEDAFRLGLRRLGGGLPATSVRDVRFAARSLARTPLFTVAVVATLGLGIGANAALFTVVNGVMLQPLPYRQSDRLVQLLTSREGPPRSQMISTPDFDDLQERIRTVEHLSLRVWAEPTYQADRPIVLNGASVSSGYLQLFGGRPHLGRYFVPEDDEQGRDPSVVLSYGTWQRVFGADPDVVGGTVPLNGGPRTVVGVADPAMRTTGDPLALAEAAR